MKSYLGIDLAGEGAKTAVAEILAADEGLFYQFPQLPDLQGEDGREALEARFRTAEKTAVDQPFSYPAACMHWFQGASEPESPSEAYLWRHTDVAMAERVTNLGLSRATVQQVGLSANLWRAVALASFLGVAREVVCRGKGRLFETHPRVAWAVVIASLADRETAEDLVAHHHRGGGGPPEERGRRSPRRQRREKMLRLLTDGTGLRPRSEGQKDLAIQNDDSLDALICAFVAYLSDHSAAERCLPAKVSEETILLEGAALLPSQDWQARLLVKKGHH